MRLDKYLKLTQLIKRRTVAKESSEDGVISVNGVVAKPAKRLVAGDTIEIDMWNYYKKVKVLQIPTRGNIPKAKIDEFVEVIEYVTK